MTLYNNFLLKRGVGLFSRVGLISGDYGTRGIIMYLYSSSLSFTASELWESEALSVIHDCTYRKTDLVLN